MPDKYLNLADSESRALLNGASVLFVPMKPQPHPDFLARGVVGIVPQWPLQDGVRWFMADGCSELVKAPFAPGDILHGREAWRMCWIKYRIHYRADDGPLGFNWTRASSMDSRHIRHKYPVLSVSAMHLPEITEEDALKAGGWKYADCPVHKNPIRSYQAFWKSRYPKLDWSTWVWRVELERKD